ncbi:DNA repair protein rad2 [Chytridiales sp. JEL 0842]|nr:DNA repair protein rad2 [Chytridiales sp. JEL 0842]
MGVKSLWKLIEPTATNSRLETLSGQRLAVDASIWLHQFLKAMRDSEGKPVKGAHILGLFRRICKILFYGIRPVFVFDGATPALKRRTVVKRKKRNTEASEGVVRTAEKLLMAQMKMRAVENAERNKNRTGGNEDDDMDEGDARRPAVGSMIPKDAVYMDETITTMPKTRMKGHKANETLPVASTTPATSSSSPSKDSLLSTELASKSKSSSKRKRDEFDLPAIDEISNTLELSRDMRYADEDELRDFISSHRHEVDFSSLNFDSKSFAELPVELQYQIILDLKTRSREASSMRVSELASAENAMDFSLLQIRNLVHRNTLTEKLFDIAKTGGMAVNPALAKKEKENEQKRMAARKNFYKGSGYGGMPQRIASVRGREYILVKNDDMAGAGHTMKWVKEETGKLVEKGKLVPTTAQALVGSLRKKGKTVIEIDENGKTRETYVDESDDSDMNEEFVEVKMDTDVLESIMATGGPDNLLATDSIDASVRQTTKPLDDGAPLFSDSDDDNPLFSDTEDSKPLPRKNLNASKPIKDFNVDDHGPFVDDNESIEKIEEMFALKESQDAEARKSQNTPATNPDAVSDDLSESQIMALFAENDERKNANADMVPDHLSEDQIMVLFAEKEERKKGGTSSSTAVSVAQSLLEPPAVASESITNPTIEIHTPPIPPSEPSSVWKYMLQKHGQFTDEIISTTALLDAWKRKAPANLYQLVPTADDTFNAALCEDDPECLKDIIKGLSKRMDKTAEGEDEKVEAIRFVQLFVRDCLWRLEYIQCRRKVGLAVTNEEVLGAADVKNAVLERDIAGGYSPTKNPDSLMSETMPTHQSEQNRTSASISTGAKTIKDVHLHSAPSDEPIADRYVTSTKKATIELSSERKPSPKVSPTAVSPQATLQMLESKIENDREPKARKRPSRAIVGLDESDSDGVDIIMKKQKVDDKDSDSEEADELPSAADALKSNPLSTASQSASVLLGATNGIEDDEDVDIEGLMGIAPTESMKEDEEFAKFLTTVKKTNTLTSAQSLSSHSTAPATFNTFSTTHGPSPVIESGGRSMTGPSSASNTVNDFLSTGVAYPLADAEQVQNTLKEMESEINRLKIQKKKDARDADTITSTMIQESQELLKLFGIPFIVAPMEAESQCAWLKSAGLVDGIITDDSDVFLFGGTMVYKNVFNANKYVEQYTLSNLETSMGLNRCMLVLLAYLLGSDYTEGIQGIGVVTAMEILKEWGVEAVLAEYLGVWKTVKASTRAENVEEGRRRREGNQKLLDCLQGFKDWVRALQRGRKQPDESAFRKKFRKKAFVLEIPEGFPDPRVMDAYLDPMVDTDEHAFEWGVPDLEGLRDFLEDKVGFDQAKTDEVVIPVIREMNRRRMEPSQTHLDRFFQRDRIGTHSSERIQRVVEGLKKVGQGPPNAQLVTVQKEAQQTSSDSEDSSEPDSPEPTKKKPNAKTSGPPPAAVKKASAISKEKPRQPRVSIGPRGGRGRGKRK